MFLFERLFGVGVYALVLAVMCFYIKGLTDYKKIKTALNIYTLILAVLGFLYVPYITSDLYRIYKYVDYFGSFSFVDLWKESPWNSEVGIAAFYYAVIGKIGIPRLLPFINALVCYNCIFYIICNFAKKRNISGKNIAIALFFYMSTGNFIFVISGIRCMLGVSLFSFCFFRESIEKKFSILHIPMYLVAALIHPFAAVLIALRFVISVFDSKVSFLKRIVLLGGLGLGGIVIFKYFNGYVLKIFEKVESYISGDMYSYFWEYVIAVFVALVAGVAVINFRKNPPEGRGLLNSWNIYSLILLIISIFMCFEFTTFHRLATYIIPIIITPILMSVMQKDEERVEINTSLPIIDRPITFSSCVVVISLVVLLVACARGSLSSLKFFEF